MSFTDLIITQQPDNPAEVYISGAIQGSRDLGHAKVLYQHAAHAFHDAGINVYIPHLHPAPTAGQARAMNRPGICGGALRVHLPDVNTRKASW